MKTAYYAHPMAYYGTTLETQDEAAIRALGLLLVNPNDPQYEGLSMDQFVKLALSCDVVAFRAFKDGRIGSGVGLEIEAARQRGKPVIELPWITRSRILSRVETRGRIYATKAARLIKSMQDSEDQLASMDEWGAQ